MARKGREFELAYKWLYELDKNKYKVTSPAKVYDKASEKEREIDDLIEYKDNNGDLRRIYVECRDRKGEQDQTWLEQLITKKEDLELDYLIATTTNKFTNGAIKKARYHGVIIEEAEHLDKNIVDNISNEFVADLFFLKFEISELSFLINGQIKSFKSVFSSIGLIEQAELLKFLNNDYYCSINPHKIMEDGAFDKDTFFKHTDNSYITQNGIIPFESDCPDIIKRLGIKVMYISIKMVPYRVSLPLNKSLSVFDVNPRKNKKYSACFGSEDEYLRIGYLDDGKSISEIKLKSRRYYRFLGINMKVNTIFPNGVNDTKINMDELIEKGIGEFDIRKII